MADLGVSDHLRHVVHELGGNPRTSQQQMAAAVLGALDTRSHLLVQAGTGTGKSLAYLVPAALHALDTGQPVLVATATLNLQRQLIDKDIPVLQRGLRASAGREVDSALLKGRQNYVCRLRLASDAGDAAQVALPGTSGRLEDLAARVVEWSQTSETGDRDDFGEPIDARVWRALSVSGRECVGRTRCPFGEECFAELARDRARDADIIVTNHALLAIHLQSEMPVLPEVDAVVIDEAHEFVDRVTAASTQQLTATQLTGVVRAAAAHMQADAVERLQRSAENVAEALDDAAHSDAPGQGHEMSEGLVAALARLREECQVALTEIPAAASEVGAEELATRQRVRSNLLEIHDLSGRIIAADEEDVIWVGDSAGASSVSCAPLRVAHVVREGLLSEMPVVATSATLQLGGSFRGLAGDMGLVGEGSPDEAIDHEVGSESEKAPAAPGRWRYVDVGSPFDYERQGILYCPEIPPPGREGISDAQLAEIGSLVRAAAGDSLILSTSWRSVDLIEEYLRDLDLPGCPLLVQRRGEPPARLVSEFATTSGSVLVGTRSLWQGVDAPGPNCRLVVVERIPFPRPDDPVLSARQRLADSAGRSGFAEVPLPRAALLMAQGAGRLIRSPEDRGVVAVLDSRLLSRRGYSSYLMRSLPRFWVTRDRSDALSALQRLAVAGTPGEDGDRTS